MPVLAVRVVDELTVAEVLEFPHNAIWNCIVLGLLKKLPNMLCLHWFQKCWRLKMVLTVLEMTTLKVVLRVLEMTTLKVVLTVLEMTTLRGAVKFNPESVNSRILVQITR